MFATIEGRLREIARRAGFARVPTPVLLAGMALLTVAVVAALVRWWPKPEDAGGIVVSRSGPAATVHAADSSGESSGSAGAVGSAGTTESVCVHVVGAVRHPGVYRLATGSRVDDAVRAAGGATGAAQTAAINLAAVLEDGTQVAVPTEAEAKAASAGGGSVVASAGRATNGSAAGTSGSGSPVNVNTADATALDALPGIGPSTAAKIVADRQANGAFKSVDDLGRIPGIGPKKLEQLKPLVCVR